MKEKFIDKKFKPESLSILGSIDQVLSSYRMQGYNLTLRQLYYQLVARDLLPDSYVDPATGSKNNIRSYKKIGDLVSDARQAGLIDWSAIVDRGRVTEMPTYWRNPGHIVEVAMNQFRIDKWERQPYHIEVMCEKDALSGVLGPVCSRLEVNFTANKGYTSSSAAYWMAKRLEMKMADGKEVIVLYFGDHDPSGIDMTRDVLDRLNGYAWSRNIEVRRMALNMDQVEMWNPPVNPAKDTDARYDSYRTEFGDDCWELDAVEPEELVRLVEEEILSVRDLDLWDEATQEQEGMRKKLKKFADEWRKV